MKYRQKAEWLCSNLSNIVSHCIHDRKSLWDLHETTLYKINIVFLVILYRKFFTYTEHLLFDIKFLHDMTPFASLIEIVHILSVIVVIRSNQLFGSLFLPRKN